MKKTLKNLIDERKLDYVSSYITEDTFPLSNRKVESFKLYHFDKYISSEDAIEEMKKDEYAPANIDELLSWKDWNEKDLVVALGSVGGVSGHRRVPCLYRGDSRRGLHLGWFDRDWGAGYRFLGVRLLSSGTQTSEKSALEPLEALTLEARIKALEEDMQKIKKFLII